MRPDYSRPSRVVLIDDDGPYRAYVAALVDSEADLEVAGEAGDVETGLAVVARERSDVLLLDIEMPGLRGSAAVARFLAAVPDLKIIMLTAFDGDEVLLESIQAGACGYLLKGSSSAQVLAAVRDVLAGGAPMSRGIARRVLELLRQPMPGPAVTTAAPELKELTDRERDVIELVAQGLLDKEIADRLGVAVPTVKNHLANIYVKWRVRSRTEAAVKLVQGQQQQQQ